MVGRRWVLAVGLLAAVVPVASCSDGGGSDPAARAPASGGSSGLATGEQAGGPSARPVEDRRIAYTADLTVRVPDAEAASSRATAIAERAGGYLAGQEADLAGAEASAGRLRGLLAEAPSTSDLVAIEHELADREQEVESLQGKLRVLDDQTSLATITAELGEDVAAPADDDPPSFLAALKAGTHSVYRLGQVLAAAVGFLLPFVPIALLVALGVRWWRRRHRRRPTGTLGSGGPGGPPVAPHLPPPPGVAGP
ncbi:MAG: DUF4349 domain-containing protein [Actinobacteria bacterium]|nr:DUF4349 domain-containing protein [Actinomycetota bacterium]